MSWGEDGAAGNCFEFDGRGCSRGMFIGGNDCRKIWDFDEMLRAKKAERKKQRRRRKDGSIYIGNDADEQIRMLTEAMKAAAKV